MSSCTNIFDFRQLPDDLFSVKTMGQISLTNSAPDGFGSAELTDFYSFLAVGISNPSNVFDKQNRIKVKIC